MVCSGTSRPFSLNAPSSSFLPAASLLLSPELMTEQRPEPDSPNNLTGGGVGVSNQTDVIELLTVDILSCMGSYAHGGYVSMCPYSPVACGIFRNA